MAYLFDTDAISELLRPRPARAYVEWLAAVPRADQYTSAVVVGELFEGALRSRQARHLDRIVEHVLPAITVLPYDIAVAQVFGRVQAALGARGRALADADAMIAATAIHHGLALVSGNLRHYQRVDGLTIERVLVESRIRGRTT